MTDPEEREQTDGPQGRDYATVALACCVIAIAVWLFLRRGGVESGGPSAPVPAAAVSPPMPLADMRPKEEPKDGFAGSESCRECHAGNHSTWAASYHRSMTQPATAQTVVGDFNNVTLSLSGTNGLKRFHLRRNDEYFWVETFTDKELVSGPEGLPTMFPVVMTTGSHHMQVYWMSVGDKRTLGMLPVVYLREDRRWIPRRSSFLKPPGAAVSLETGRWDEGCVRCHTTGGRPQRLETADSVYYDSAVSEFGISCEACHGKGKEHVRLRREEAAKGVKPATDPITNPERMDARLSAQVCGGCHSAMIFKTAAHVHVPGKNLDTNQVELMGLNDRTREYLMEQLYPDESPEQARLNVERDLKGMYWSDGMMRVVGREYSSLRETACHLRGGMSCVSCHRLHQAPSDSRSAEEWADDQLGRGMRGDQACTQCHKEASFASRAHTGHAPTSEGSRCMNCHMPNTTYGLLKATRSHTITSPGVRETVEASRPNACNLCHLDRTLSWTAKHLEDWYGRKLPVINEPWRDTSAAVVGALRGDATVRALMAWHLGWEPALKASRGGDWVPPVLSVLMEDDYDAVRYIAGRSLARISGFENVPYDFLAPQEKQRGDIRDVLETWARLRPSALTNRAEILMTPDGKLDLEAVQSHLSGRDNRPVMIIE